METNHSTFCSSCLTRNDCVASEKIFFQMYFILILIFNCWTFIYCHRSLFENRNWTIHGWNRKQSHRLKKRIHVVFRPLLWFFDAPLSGIPRPSPCKALRIPSRFRLSYGGTNARRTAYLACSFLRGRITFWRARMTDRFACGTWKMALSRYVSFKKSSFIHAFWFSSVLLFWYCRPLRPCSSWDTPKRWRAWPGWYLLAPISLARLTLGNYGYHLCW